MTIWIVLGCPRSGTSLVAGLLHKNGVAMLGEGQRPEEDAGPRNPRGYYENLDFTHCNAAILKQHGWHVTDPPSLDWQAGEDAFLRVHRVLERYLPRADDWGWKDPRMALLWHVYRANLPADLPVRLVITHRNPLTAAFSMLQHGMATSLDDALAVVAAYEWRLVDIARETAWPTLHVSFENWWYANEMQRKALDMFTGMRMDYAHFDDTMWRAGLKTAKVQSYRIVEI